MNNYSQKAGIAPVVFDHWLHRAKFTCRICHIDIGFVMKAEATDINAADNINGYYCGSCHDGKRVVEGKVIFAACALKYTAEEEKRCVKCHSFEKNAPREYDYKTFTEDLPRLSGPLIDWEKAEIEGKISPIDYLEGISFKRDPLEAQKDFTIRVKTWRIADVIFSHKKHVAWNGCEVCHPSIFPSTKKGTVKYTMDDIMEGKYCGVCHVPVAFSVWLCRKCHKNPQM
ncbi:MAG: cytochrome c3 family protein [Desulfobulbales bacterium]|nr:cytochrome c3 family protein [Desulfobulbales bacterium]